MGMNAGRAARCGLMAGLMALAVVAWAADEVTMYKDPNCGCCGKWAEHLRHNGFTVREIATGAMAEVKREAGVPLPLGSCHTARVGGYVIEGHVPAADIRRLLAQRPPVAGLAAPGMPQGSPGMEGPYPAQRYEVLSFDRQGQVRTFARH